KITPDQESDWKAVADTMRANADDMKNLIDEARTKSPKGERNALEDLQTYQEFAQAHAGGLEKLTASFATLYNAIPPVQDANAANVSHSLEPRRPSGHERRCPFVE